MSKRSASYLFSNILDVQLSPFRKTRKYSFSSVHNNMSMMSNDDSMNLKPVYDDGINSMDLKDEQSETFKIQSDVANLTTLEADVSLVAARASTVIQLNLQHFLSSVHEVR